MRQNRQTIDLASADPKQLMLLANAGKAGALELLKKQYQDNPELVREHGDVARLAVGARLTKMVSKESNGTWLAIRNYVDDMTRQIAGEHPTPLELLLAERIAICWLDVQDHELHYSMLDDRCSPRQLEWRSRMLDRAHRRYLSAIKALADVRRINLTMVQMNIAEKQINVQQPGPDQELDMADLILRG